jgi:hypothetical protein
VGDARTRRALERFAAMFLAESFEGLMAGALKALQRQTGVGKDEAQRFGHVVQ